MVIYQKSKEIWNIWLRSDFYNVFTLWCVGIKNTFYNLTFTFQVNCGLHLVIQTSSLSDKNKVRFKKICI